ncbi:hypothetical protein THAOC_37027, partial [Thalassiosira oceanica]
MATHSPLSSGGWRGGGRGHAMVCSWYGILMDSRANRANYAVGRRGKELLLTKNHRLPSPDDTVYEWERVPDGGGQRATGPNSQRPRSPETSPRGRGAARDGSARTLNGAGATAGGERRAAGEEEINKGHPKTPARAVIPQQTNNMASSGTETVPMACATATLLHAAAAAAAVDEDAGDSALHDAATLAVSLSGGGGVGESTPARTGSTPQVTPQQAPELAVSTGKKPGDFSRLVSATSSEKGGGNSKKAKGKKKGGGGSA